VCPLGPCPLGPCFGANDNVAGGRARSTEDVDFIVDISVRGEYQRFEKKMRALGFKTTLAKALQYAAGSSIFTVYR
jgi:hypothetical protein